MAIFNNITDILLDDNADLQEQDGDFLIGDCSNRYIEYITKAFQGHYKESPLVGIGIEYYLNANVNPQILERDIIKQLQDDIFITPDVDLSNYPIEIKINDVVIRK